MKEFTYVIKDEIGIHARPAGMLAKLAKSFTSKRPRSCTVVRGPGFITMIDMVIPPEIWISIN